MSYRSKTIYTFCIELLANVVESHRHKQMINHLKHSNLEVRLDVDAQATTSFLLSMILSESVVTRNFEACVKHK